MNIPSIIIICLIAAALVGVIAMLIKNKKKGKHICSCGGSCGSCPMGGSCAERK